MGPEELRAHGQEDKRWEPRSDETTRRRQFTGWKKAVTRTFAWVE
jgi:glycerol kinase